MKKTIVIFSIASLVLWGIQFIGQATKAETTFPDVPEDTWMYPYIEELVNDGIVEGDKDGNFYPWKVANRAEVAKMIVLMKAQIQGNWLQNHFIEILLVLATLIGWMSVFRSFKKSQHELIEKLSKNTRENALPIAPAPFPAPERAANTSTKSENEEIEDNEDNEDNEENESEAIEKNLKSNWWV